MRLLDLSRRLETGMPVFPGHPPVALRLTEAEPPRQIMAIHLGTHSGTHIDAPRHFVPGGRTIDQYELKRFIVPTVVARVELSADEEIQWELLAHMVAQVPKGGALLIETDWDRHWGQEMMRHHPYLAIGACERIAHCGVGLVGTDAVNVDCTGRRSKEVHETLLGSDVLIVENLTNLSEVRSGRVIECGFVPLCLIGADGSPVRAYARLG